MTANILIVDGYSTGKLYAGRVRRRGMVPYHLTTGKAPETSSQSKPDDNYEKTFQIPPKGIEDILPVLQRLNFAAIIPGAESGVEIAEYLATYFALPSNDAKTTPLRRQKYLMQEAVKKCGLKYIPSLETNDLQEALRFRKDPGGGAFVIKPVKSAGTDGLKICNTENDFCDYFAALLGSKDFYGNINDKVIIQPYINGEEVYVNCVSRNGKHILTDICHYKKIKAEGAFPVYDATVLKRDLDARHKQAIAYAFKVLDALGVKYGPSHTEIMLTEDGPVLIESGARLVGGIHDTYLEALGYDVFDWALDSFLDEAAHNKNASLGYSPKKAFLIKWFISGKEAELVALPAPKALSYLPGAREINFSSALKNKKIPKTVDLATRAGECSFIGAEDEVIRSYKTARFLETAAPRLLWQSKEDGPPNEREKEILEKLKHNISIEDEIEKFSKLRRAP